jgi:hypothetical protein
MKPYLRIHWLALLLLVFILSGGHTLWAQGDKDGVERHNLTQASIGQFVNLYKNLDSFPPVDITTSQYSEAHTWLPDRGLRGLWLQVRGQFDWKAMEFISDEPVFHKGPHQGWKLNLKSGNSFGHYNPAFVDWFRHHVIGAFNTEAVRNVAQPHYDRYIKRRARTYAIAYHRYRHQGMVALPKYKKLVEDADTEDSRPGDFLRKSFGPSSRHAVKEGYDFEETITAHGFWLRRHLDKSEHALYTTLDKLVRFYDPDFPIAAIAYPMGTTLNDLIYDTWETLVEGGCQKLPSHPIILRLLRNTPFAMRGHQFKSKELRTFFSLIAPKYRKHASGKLSPAEKICVKKLAALEKKQRKAGVNQCDAEAEKILSSHPAAFGRPLNSPNTTMFRCFINDAGEAEFSYEVCGQDEEKSGYCDGQYLKCSPKVDQGCKWQIWG